MLAEIFLCNFTLETEYWPVLTILTDAFQGLLALLYILRPRLDFLGCGGQPSTCCSQTVISLSTLYQMHMAFKMQKMKTARPFSMCCCSSGVNHMLQRMRVA